MTLDSLKKGMSAIIVNVEAERELKNRFNSFGVVKGATVFVEQKTFAKQTIEIRINHTRIALRASEAMKVVVEPETKPALGISG